MRAFLFHGDLSVSLDPVSVQHCFVQQYADDTTLSLVMYVSWKMVLLVTWRE